MKIAIGSDHGGYALKKELLPLLEEMDVEFVDFGCHDESSCDYPDYAFMVAEAVADGTYDYGILVCGTGIGISIAANKVDGIRCALCTDATMARLTREHNDANVLAMGGRIVGAELAKDIVRAFLQTPFSQGARHQKRVDKIMAYKGDAGK